MPCTQDLSQAPARAARDANHRLVVRGARFMRGRVGAHWCPLMLGQLKRLARLVTLTGAALLLRVVALQQAAAAPRMFSVAPAALTATAFTTCSLALGGGPSRPCRCRQPSAETDAVTNCSDSATSAPAGFAMRWRTRAPGTGSRSRAVSMQRPDRPHGRESRSPTTFDAQPRGKRARRERPRGELECAAPVFAVGGGAPPSSGLTNRGRRGESGRWVPGGAQQRPAPVTDATLSDNSAPNCGGGGVFNDGGTLTIIESTL